MTNRLIMKSHDKKAQTTCLKWLLLILVILVIGGGFAGIRWATFARPPLPEALQALESNELVTVTQEQWLTFSPTQITSKTGFIFYPGGRIDPRGYAPLMKAIAAKGYLVVVPKMPLNIAAFRPNIANKIIAAYPDTGRWVIGGHSVGGAMAAQYTDQHREAINGLAIWAAYPPDNTDISDLDIPVVSIYGSRELRVNDASVAERQHLLPENTLYIRIKGGDHHQFGSYEIEPKDHLATTSRSIQHQQIIEATLDLLEIVSNSQ